MHSNSAFLIEATVTIPIFNFTINKDLSITSQYRNFLIFIHSKQAYAEVGGF